MILRTTEIEPPQEHDNRQHLTGAPGVFFQDVWDESLRLTGKEYEFPVKTPVWIVLRANGRILLQTADKFHRWADRSFLETQRQKTAAHSEN